MSYQDHKESTAMDTLMIWVRSVLQTTPERWISLTSTLPDELLLLPPVPQEWSVYKCLGHLLETERLVFPVRVSLFLAGQDFPDFDPNTQGTKPLVERSAAELAVDFAALRRKSLELLDQLQSGDLSRRVRHSELGPVTLEELLHEWAAHDLNHTMQAERALMQPFIAGSGPWQPSFAHHKYGGTKHTN
jgi:uncharacterized damage-inducible protein DinB